MICGYDEWDRIEQTMTKLNGQHVKTYYYKYDAENLRYEKTVNGVTTRYYYNAGQLQAEERGDEFIYYLYGIEGITGMIYNGQYYFYKKNVLGDVTEIYNSNGSEVASYDYDAWGNVINKSGTMADVNPIRYRGYYYDSETGFYYLNTRYYDPEIRRFVNADNYELLPELAGVYGQANLYTYCNNNPVMYTDPTGEFVLSAFLISLAVGAATGGVMGTISAAMQGEALWKGLVIGALSGAVMGAAFGMGGAVGAGAFAAGKSVSVATSLLAFGATTAGAFGAGVGIYALETKLYDTQFDWEDALLSGGSYAIRGAMNFGMGLWLGATGYFRDVKGTEKLKLMAEKFYLKNGISWVPIFGTERIFEELMRR